MGVTGLRQAANTAQALSENAGCLRVSIPVPGGFHVRDGLARILFGARVVTQAHAGRGDVEAGPGPLAGVARLRGKRDRLGGGLVPRLAASDANPVPPVREL